MRRDDNWLDRTLREHHLGRRQFIELCGAVAATFSLPLGAAKQIAHAIEHKPKPTLVWLEFQDCAGNSESFLRASKPSAAEVILDALSVDYHETIMAAAGHQAEGALRDAVERNKGSFIAVVEGSIPTADGGVYCTIGGKSAEQIVREVCSQAAATLAVGTCASFGGLPAAAPNPTGAKSVLGVVPDIKNLVNLPACPVNAENLTAVIVYYLTYGRLPPLDAERRPRFAYGKTIHDNCERRAHFDAGQYVEAFGDAGHRRGYCLFKVGCKGPATYQNCPVIRWNDGTNWPIGCGHPCIGCAEPAFWDTMTPFYEHLDGITGAGVGNVDTIGALATLGVAAAFAGHGLVSVAKTRMARRREAAAAATATASAAVPTPVTPDDPSDKQGDTP